SGSRAPLMTTPHTPAGRLNVGMIGYGFMGAAHSHAWRNAQRFIELPLTPHLHTLSGRTAGAVEAAAERFGFASHTTRWQDVVEDPALGVVDICPPGDTQYEVAIAAPGAGKHVVCRKPLANSVEEVEEMTAAAAA